MCAAQEHPELEGEAAAPPVLTLRDLLTRQRGLRLMRAGWSIGSTTGKLNIIRTTLALVSGLLLERMVAAHGIDSWTTVATLILAAGATANLVFSNVIALRTITIAEWIMRLGMGDLKYRVRLSGKDELAFMCDALERVRDRSVRVVKLSLVEHLAAELEKSNAELRETVESLTKAQDQIVARQKASELGELTAGVAREIRIPLKSVMRFTESSRELVRTMGGTVRENRDALVAEEMEAMEEIETDIEEDLELVVAHARRADAIVDRMLMLGTAQGAVERVRLNDLVGEHARLACAAAELSSGGIGVRLEEAYDDAVGTVTVVRQGIARIVLNLVGNACYAVHEPRKREAQGYEPTIWISTRKTADGIEIVVRDNGPGIDEAIIDKVMTPFFTTKPANVGVGLGLSQCADAAQQHGGTIGIESRVGAGTTVRIGLPAQGVTHESDKSNRGGPVATRARRLH